MSEPSALFEWPKPHGGRQRTQHALGRPVDVNALFGVIDRIDEECEETISEADKKMEQILSSSRNMVDTIDQAIDDLDKRVRTRMSQEIIGRLNKIDRHDVATIIKEVIAEIDEIQTNMRRARA